LPILPTPPVFGTSVGVWKIDVRKQCQHMTDAGMDGWNCYIRVVLCLADTQ